jgi:hypothetical protein
MRVLARVVFPRVALENGDFWAFSKSKPLKKAIFGPLKKV